MPDPPSVDLVTRYIFENPYPLGVGLLILGVIIGWLGLREGRADRVRAAGAPLLLGAAALVTGFVVVTAGERAKSVTRDLVAAAVANDLTGASALVAPDATVHFGSTRNLGLDRNAIIDGLSRLSASYAIEDNRITMLKAYTESRERATVHLACWTSTVNYGGYTPSQWVLEVERQSDGTWQVSRITCISISGQAPPASWIPR
jgi:hypothetical protein